MTREESQQLQELTKELAELKGYLKAELPNLSDRLDELRDALKASKPSLSNKQIAAIVGVTVPLISALTTFLTGLAV